MPILVLHELGKPPRQVPLEAGTFRIGRDPECCDVVLPGSTVSREHALLVENRGTWFVRCLSATNPVVVNGILVREGSLLGEGAEIMIGTEHLLIFCLDKLSAASYMGPCSFFAHNECAQCHWQGPVSTLRRKPICPACGSSRLRAEHVYQKDEAARAAALGDTRSAKPSEVRQMLEMLRKAKRSRLERLDGMAEPRSVELTESEPVRLGRQEGDRFRLEGLVLGTGAVVCWETDHFVVQSHLTFPAVRVNGKRVKKARLEDGDLIRIGSNRFRFTTRPKEPGTIR